MNKEDKIVYTLAIVAIVIVLIFSTWIAIKPPPPPPRRQPIEGYLEPINVTSSDEWRFRLHVNYTADPTSLKNEKGNYNIMVLADYMKVPRKENSEGQNITYEYIDKNKSGLIDTGDEIIYYLNNKSIEDQVSIEIQYYGGFITYRFEEDKGQNLSIIGVNSQLVKSKNSNKS